MSQRSPAQYTLALLEAVNAEQMNEISRRTGNVLRVASRAIPMSYGLVGLIKAVTRSYHNLEGDVKRYRLKKKAIRQDPNKTQQQKRREIDALEKATVASLGAKVRAARNRKRMHRGRGAKPTTRRDVRAAKRAIYGTTFGSRVL
jgi:hypothetical protein